MIINGLILAAGLSSRMGDFKPLMPLNGKSIIENSIDSMLLSGVSKVKVVIGHNADEIDRLVSEKYYSSRVATVYNKFYASSDMLKSVKIGLENFPICDAFFLLPGDMPAITPATFLLLMHAMGNAKTKVIFPVLQGRRKHPPLILADCINDILSFDSDGGLRDLWKQYEGLITEINVDDKGCGFDVDTIEDYQLLKQYFRGKISES
jgi:CTP:molybdopterin cytidylyltransferase MocA